jgi:hypothetical protein
MKAAINPTTMSIQFWPSKPRKVKCSTRNRTSPAPFLCSISALFVQDKDFCVKNILLLYFSGPVRLDLEKPFRASPFAPQIDQSSFFRNAADTGHIRRHILPGGIDAWEGLLRAPPASFAEIDDPTRRRGGSAAALCPDGLIAFVSDARAKRQQFVELRGIVTGSVRARDEDLPALLCKGAPLGDRDDSA